MTLSMTNLKSLSLALVTGGLVLVGVAEARLLQEHGHGAHGHAEQKPVEKQEFAGDPYLLDIDAVSGKPLGPVEEQVVIQHERREIRFSGKQTMTAFMAEPTKYLPLIDKQMIEQQLPFYPLDTCIVSGEKLDAEMGEPVNVIYRNRLVRLCCSFCEKKLTENPGPQLAKLDKAVIAAQKKAYPLTTCPISGEQLGTMGDPIEVVMGNRLVLLCCKGCVKRASKDPIAALGKLDAALAAEGNHREGGHGGAHGNHDHNDG